MDQLGTFSKTEPNLPFEPGFWEEPELPPSRVHKGNEPWFVERLWRGLFAGIVGGDSYLLFPRVEHTLHEQGCDEHETATGDDGRQPIVVQ